MRKVRSFSFYSLFSLNIQEATLTWCVCVRDTPWRLVMKETGSSACWSDVITVMKSLQIQVRTVHTGGSVLVSSKFTFGFRQQFWLYIFYLIVLIFICFAAPYNRNFKPTPWTKTLRLWKKLPVQSSSVNILSVDFPLFAPPSHSCVLMYFKWPII